MATLEHVQDEKRNHYRLRVTIDRRRKTIGLGDFDEAAAIIAKEHIEHLVGQHKRDRPPNERTSVWLDGIPGEIHDRLASLDLVTARKRCDLPRTIIAYMRAYIASRTDWKKPANYTQAVDKLLAFLRRDAPLKSLSKGDVQRWHRWLMSERGGQLSANTAGQNIKRCRQIMRQAIDDGLVDENPFVGVKIDLRSDKTKMRYVDVDQAAAILDACPDQEWRVIVALARFGGMRCPSEVLGLRWCDVTWDRGRMLVTAPKTERYGKGERVTPLFPPLLAELQDLYDIAAPGVKCAGDAFVIQRYRKSESNLRTTFNKIVTRAGMKPFPKPFINLRSSARTELERSGRFANHVLNDWFGHSGDVAETYYLQTTEDDFDEAARLASLPATAADEPRVPDSGLEGHLEGQSLGQPQGITQSKKPRKNGALMAASGAGLALRPEKYTRRDSSLNRDSHRKTQGTIAEGVTGICFEGQPEGQSVATIDPQTRERNRLWEAMSEADRVVGLRLWASLLNDEREANQ